MGKLRAFLAKSLERVNVQVSVLTCALIVFSCCIIYLVTSTVMISMLEDAYNERTNLTFETIKSHIDSRLYEDDVKSGVYSSVMSYLAATKDNMAISRIGIIKKCNDGGYVYVLNTQNSDKNSIVKNVPVEDKIVKAIDDVYVTNRSGNGNFYSMGTGFKYINFYPDTSYGKDVQAVICISIDTGGVRIAQIVLRILVLIIILLCCLISIRFSNRIFKKISNPLYQDASNTDALTNLKNKNSFAVDMHNIENGATERYAVVTIDLNGLKNINDTRGHQIGDMYIQRAAKIIREAMVGTDFIGYRIGGDEFSILMKDKTVEEIKQFVQRIDEETEEINKNSGMQVTMSIGYAKFDKDRDRNFSDTIERSDTMMYENKRHYYRMKNQTMR